MKSYSRRMEWLSQLWSRRQNWKNNELVIIWNEQLLVIKGLTRSAGAGRKQVCDWDRKRMQKSTRQSPDKSTSRIKRWMNQGVQHVTQDVMGIQKHIAVHDLRSFGTKS